MIQRPRNKARSGESSTDSSPYQVCVCRYRVIVYSGGCSRDARVRCLRLVAHNDVGLFCIFRDPILETDELDTDDALFGPSPFEGPYSDAEIEDLVQRLEELT